MGHPGCASSEPLGSGQSLSLPENVSTPETQAEAVAPVTAPEKYERENKPHIHLHSALEFASRLPASSSQIPVRKEETSVECLLCARNRTGCLFTFISCQLHHSLQMGIVILIHFTLEETEVTLLGSSRANI